MIKCDCCRERIKGRENICEIPRYSLEDFAKETKEICESCRVDLKKIFNKLETEINKVWNEALAISLNNFKAKKQPDKYDEVESPEINVHEILTLTGSENVVDESART